MGIRVSTQIGLPVRKFRNGPLDLQEGKWTEVDPADKEVRADLMRFVPSHVRVNPDDVPKLGEFNLALKGNRLVNLEAEAPPAPKAPAKAKKEQPAG